MLIAVAQSENNPQQEIPRHQYSPPTIPRLDTQINLLDMPRARMRVLVRAGERVGNGEGPAVVIHARGDDAHPDVRFEPFELAQDERACGPGYIERERDSVESKRGSETSVSEVQS